MNREVKMIAAGGMAGILSGSLAWMAGQFNGRGMILGIFLAIGVIFIEKISAQKLTKGRYPDISKILTTALITGILAGLMGYYTIMNNHSSSDLGGMYRPYIFSYLQYTLIISLYPLLILPAFFAKGKYLLTVFAGTCASVVIETFRAMAINGMYSHKTPSIPELLYSAVLSALFSGFAFTLLWVMFIAYAGRPTPSRNRKGWPWPAHGDR